MKKGLKNAVCALKSGNKDKAAWILERLIENGNSHHETLGLLGAVRMEQGKTDEAVKLLTQAITQAPEHVPSLYNLARTLHIKGDHEEAKKLYIRITTISPSFYHAWNNLGLLQKETGDLMGAKQSLRKALAIAPGHAPCLNNLGVVMEGLGRLDEACSLFKGALALDSGYFSARFNLGCLLFRLGRYEEAEKELLHVLALNKDEPTARFLLQSMGRMKAPERAPAEYVKRTFDDCAGQFEEILVGRLQYRTPEKLFGFLQDLLDYKWSIMDLGCGTGLGAHRYRPFASFLAGMDCSRKMLREAMAKGVYDALYQGDIVERWPTDRKFHLVYSSDCLCYMGALEPVFKRIKKSLYPGGILGFSVEKMKKDEESRGYQLGKSGRYRHSHGYVKTALERAGLKHIKDLAITLRKEEGKDVKGLLFAAQKAVT